MSSNFCMKFATQIKYLRTIKAILSSKLLYKPEYFKHCDMILNMLIFITP